MAKIVLHTTIYIYIPLLHLANMLGIYLLEWRRYKMTGIMYKMKSCT